MSYLHSLYDTLHLRAGNVGIGTTNPTHEFQVQGTISVDRLTNDTGLIDMTYSTLSNIQTINVDKLTTQTYGHINVDGKTLSNIGAMQTDSMLINTLSSTQSWINVDYKSLSNVTSVSLSNITSPFDNINMSGKTLSNIGTVSLSNIVSPTGILNVSLSSLSNVKTLSLSNLTTESDTIYFSGKTLSNIAFAHVAEDLRVAKNLYASNLYVVGDFTTMNTLTSNTEQMTVTNIGTGPALIVSQTGAEPVAAFYDGEEANVAMQIVNGGFVGFGTAAPDTRVHVYDTAAVLTHIQTTTAGQAQVKLTNSSGDTYVGPSATGAIQVKSTAVQPMYIGTNSLDTVTLLTDGNVGIGSTAPAYTLDVAGPSRVTGLLYQRTGASGLEMNTVNFGFGKVALTNTSTHVGFNLAWTTAGSSATQAFRVSVRCHLASATSVAYRKFEALINPVDNTTTTPSQIVAAEVADTESTEFVNLTHTATRSSANSVDIKVQWSSVPATFVGNVQVEVFADTALGEFSYTAISD